MGTAWNLTTPAYPALAQYFTGQHATKNFVEICPIFTVLPFVGPRTLQHFALPLSGLSRHWFGGTVSALSNSEFGLTEISHLLNSQTTLSVCNIVVLCLVAQCIRSTKESVRLPRLQRRVWVRERTQSSSARCDTVQQHRRRPQWATDSACVCGCVILPF